MSLTAQDVDRLLRFHYAIKDAGILALVSQHLADREKGFIAEIDPSPAGGRTHRLTVGFKGTPSPYVLDLYRDGSLATPTFGNLSGAGLPENPNQQGALPQGPADIASLQNGGLRDRFGHQLAQNYVLAFEGAVRESNVECHRKDEDQLAATLQAHAKQHVHQEMTRNFSAFRRLLDRDIVKTMITAQLRDAGSYNYFLAADRGHDPAIQSHRRQAAEQFPILARTMIENPTLRDDIDRGRQPDDALSSYFATHPRLRANGHQPWRVPPAIASLKSVSPRQAEGSSHPEDIVFSKLGPVRTDYDRRIVERHLNDQLPSLRHIPAFENSQAALAEISRNPKLYASLVVSDYALRDIVDMQQDLIRFCVRPSLLVLAGYADAEHAGEAYLAIGSVINRPDHPRLKGLERAEDYARNVIMSEFKTPRQIFEAAEHWDAMRPTYKSTIAFAFQDEMKRPMEWNMAVQPYQVAGHTVIMLTSAEEIERECRNLGTDHYAKLGSPEHGFQPVFAIKNGKNETTSLFNAYPRYGEIKISHHQRAPMPAPKGSLDRPSNKVSALSADGAIAILWAKRVQEKQLKSNFLAYANHQHRDWLPQDRSAVFGQAKRQLVWANLRGASPVMLPHPTPEEFLRTWKVLEVMQGAPIPVIPSASVKPNTTHLAI